ncbi:histidine kinase [Zavarzinella formosa]|uniref:HAMP domain-containing histidine kinase n=1 Tax=Zavarzinella formosa TaxID=360055 RepID=UPI000495A515|nr:HAMP domain-containing histidine kinase [Zavarzinella formosa]
MSTETTLTHLAPFYLPFRRVLPTDGGEFKVALAEFAPADRVALRRIYVTLQAVANAGASQGDEQARMLAEQTILDEVNDEFSGIARRLGEATGRTGPRSQLIRKAVHDVRGSGLTVLIGMAELLHSASGNAEIIRSCVESAKSHVRIMRSLFPDIDPRSAQTDREADWQCLGPILDKWDGAEMPGPAGPVQVRVRNTCGRTTAFRGSEAPNLDRVLYNLINNAMRFAADSEVGMWVFPVRNGLVRWVIRNRLTPKQVEFLLGNLHADFKSLYAGGITTDGHGIGLANCAEIVAACFGVDSPDQAVEEKYLGAVVEEGSYYAWFHWPSYLVRGCVQPSVN